MTKQSEPQSIRGSLRLCSFFPSRLIRTSKLRWLTCYGLEFYCDDSKAIKTTTRCAVDVALRGGSEMLFYVETGTLTIELSKTYFTVYELSCISRNKDIITR